MTKDYLRDICEPYGRVNGVQIILSRAGKYPFSFVEFDTLSAAIKAKEGLHNMELKGNPVRTDFAIPKDRRDRY